VEGAALTITYAGSNFQFNRIHRLLIQLQST